MSTYDDFTRAQAAYLAAPVDPPCRRCGGETNGSNVCETCDAADAGGEEESEP